MNIYTGNKRSMNIDFMNMMMGRKSITSNYSKTSVSVPFKAPVRSAKRDTLTISETGRKVSASTAHRNTSVDKTIDLQKYIDQAAEKNKQQLENVGSELNRNAVKYTGEYEAFTMALNDKYSKVSKAALGYSDKENYLQDKYFNKNSSIYECDLTEQERCAGYKNEKAYLTTGSVRGIDFGDSLFRGKAISGDYFDKDRLCFERSVLSKQIENALTKTGVKTDSDMKLTVDPYSYKITVEGVDDETKAAAEIALNVGENGYQLWRHTRIAAVQDGCNSKQYSKDGYMKYQAVKYTKEYSGQDIRDLNAKNGTYYTDNGEDVRELVDKGVDKDTSVPMNFKQQVKDWVRGLISETFKRGLSNLPDLKLSIMFTKKGLVDIGQDWNCQEMCSPKRPKI